MSGSLLKRATLQLLILTFDLIAHITKSEDIQGSALMAELSALFLFKAISIFLKKIVKEMVHAP